MKQSCIEKMTADMFGDRRVLGPNLIAEQRLSEFNESFLRILGVAHETKVREMAAETPAGIPFVKGVVQHAFPIEDDHGMGEAFFVGVLSEMLIRMMKNPTLSYDRDMQFKIVDVAIHKITKDEDENGVSRLLADKVTYVGGIEFAMATESGDRWVLSATKVGMTDTEKIKKMTSIITPDGADHLVQDDE